ncbi:MAG TPA: glycosyltransferase [Ktedonobacterales bacterium]|nr:glycosyltransferase [Ktedonobacterales bacterium]
MARIVVTSFGSSGDLNPFLALGLGLRARGHDVLFAVEERFHQILMLAGFTTHHLTGDIETALAATGRRMFGRLTPFPSVRTFVDQYILPTLRPKVMELLDACADAALLVAAAGQLSASFVADLTGIPWVTVALTPGTIPSAYLDPQPLPLSLPVTIQPLVNRVAWDIGAFALRRIADTPVNRVRDEYGLPHRGNLLLAGNLSRRLTAVAASPAFQPRPPDWPRFVRMTGFCFWDTPDLWRAPDDLEAFLARPEPVIAVSSGSVAPGVTQAFTEFYRTSLSAIQRVGARALVIGAAAGTFHDPLPDDALALPFAPFSQVYSHCTAVIHHGGIGTVAQALRAGVPALVIPWGVDQYINAEQVAHLGAGRWLQRHSYTVERAVQGLDALLHRERYREQAQALATQIVQEDGVATLCDALESVL